MLLQYSVDGYPGFDKVCLDVSAANIKARSPSCKNDQLTWRGSFQGNVLPVIALYGENGSGKSNLMGSLHLMKRIVTNDVGAFRTFSRLKPSLPSKYPVSFKVSLLIKGTLYHYSLTVKCSSIGEYFLVTEESLSQVSADRKKKVKITDRKEGDFDRNGDHVVWYFNESVRSWKVFGDTQNVPDLQRVSLGRYTEVYKWFDSMLTVPDICPMTTTSKTFKDAQDPEYIFRVRESTPIVKIESFCEGTDFLQFNMRDGTRKHLNALSLGTRYYLSLLLEVVDVLKHGRVMLLDSIDIQLNPRLKAYIVELFSTSVTNPHGAQLIFGTHDTVFMSGCPAQDLSRLASDQIYVLDNCNQITTVKSLAEYKITKKTDVARDYLRGVYGGVPVMAMSPQAFKK